MQTVTNVWALLSLVVMTEVEQASPRHPSHCRRSWFGGESRSSISNMVTLRCLLDVLVEMYDRQGNKM